MGHFAMLACVLMGSLVLPRLVSISLSVLTAGVLMDLSVVASHQRLLRTCRRPAYRVLTVPATVM
jgi:hypothetical protein